jgi:octaprenyl-diphosphate synthase
MLFQEVSQLIEKELKILEVELEQRLNNRNHLVSQISKHVCVSGGKRIRPILVLLCSKLCGYEDDRVVIYASIVEYVHIATLLHDDVIDEAATRRGTPSANNIWGNSIPILVGDYLFSLASVMVAQQKQHQILELMSDTIKTIVDGELLEIGRRRDFCPTEEDYFSVIGKKTASLFAFCCQIGAILGNKSNSLQQAMVNFGYNLGIAFQLVDDVLDLTSYQQQLGKPAGNDIKEGNITLPLIHLFKHAKPQEVDRIQNIISKAESSTTQDIEYVHKLLDKYNSDRYVMNVAADYIRQAKEELAHFDRSQFYDALLTLSDYIIQRNL